MLWGKKRIQGEVFINNRLAITLNRQLVVSQKEQRAYETHFLDFHHDKNSVSSEL